MASASTRSTASFISRLIGISLLFGCLLTGVAGAPGRPVPHPPSATGKPYYDPIHSQGRDTTANKAFGSPHLDPYTARELERQREIQEAAAREQKQREIEARAAREQAERRAFLEPVYADPDKLLWMWSRDAYTFVESLNSDELTTILTAAQTKPDSAIAGFLQQEEINPPILPPDVKQRLREWLEDENEQIAKSAVRSLDGRSKFDLDHYILEQDANAVINFASEVRYWEQWYESGQQQGAAARDEVGDSFFSGRGGKAPLEPQGAEVFGSKTYQREAAYLRRATEAYIESEPTLARLHREGWNFDLADQDKLRQMLDTLTAPLPGADPSLVYFIDSKHTAHAEETDRITATWRTKTRSDPEYLKHDNARAFMESMRGKTVILVGHIDGNRFSMARANGAERLFLSIPVLFKLAEELGILFIPVGCKSYSAGAPFGFTRPISKYEIARFIEAIPSTNAKVGDLLAALGKIGPVAVDHHYLSDYMHVVIHRKRPASAVPHKGQQERAEEVPSLIVDEVPSLIVHVPGPVYRGPSQPSGAQGKPDGPSSGSGAQPSAYDDFVRSWMRLNRPWHDRGALAWIRAEFREEPAQSLVITTVLLALLQQAVHRIRRAQRRSRRLPGGPLRFLDNTLKILWIPLAAGELLYLFWARPLSILILLGSLVLLVMTVDKDNRAA